MKTCLNNFTKPWAAQNDRVMFLLFFVLFLVGVFNVNVFTS